MARESVVIDTDTVDTSHVEEPWWELAQQLKQDLASVILMSEDDLQVTDQHQSSVSLFVVLLYKVLEGQATYRVCACVKNKSTACFQSLVDAPSTELAFALGFQEKKAEDLQETLQRVLDRREEERQSKELLQLYLKASDREGGQGELSQASLKGTAKLCHFLNFPDLEKKNNNKTNTHCLQLFSNQAVI